MNVRTQATKAHGRDGSWTGCLCTPPQGQLLRIHLLLVYFKLLVLSRLPGNINALVVHTDIPFHVSLVKFSYLDPIPPFLKKQKQQQQNKNKNKKTVFYADLFGITPVLLRIFPGN